MQLSRRILLALLSLLTAAQARIPAAEGTESLREFYKEATIAAHVRVASFDEITKNEPDHFAAVGRFEIQRAYKGKVTAGSILRVPFTYFWVMQGHDCVDFRKHDEWLIFVTYEQSGWRLTHDCHAALPVSPALSETDDKSNGEAQLERDLLAGLSDNSPEQELWNLKRLAAWHPTSISFETLHALMNTGEKETADWALYAALRGQDWRVLPLVEQKLLEYEEPPRKTGLLTNLPPLTLIVLEFRYLRDPLVVPMLARLMTQAKWHLTRSAAAGALYEVADERALEPAAQALLDPDRYVRYSALVIVSKLTKAPECNRPEDANDDAALAAASARCRQWWVETGHASHGASR